MNDVARIPWRSMPHAMKLERVKALTDEGLTASQIADAFNLGIPEYNQITRNAVIGFWNRNKIKSKSSLTSGAQVPRHRVSAQVENDRRAAAGNRLNAQTGHLKRVLRKALKGAEKPPQLPIVPAMTVADLPVAGTPMLTISAFQCRAVREDRDQYGLAMMCGHSVHHPDSSWCEYHARLFTRVQPRRKGVKPNYARRS